MNADRHSFFEVFYAEAEIRKSKPSPKMQKHVEAEFAHPPPYAKAEMPGWLPCPKNAKTSVSGVATNFSAYAEAEMGKSKPSPKMQKHVEAGFAPESNLCVRA